ncbi:MAG: hypothetical protein QM489_03170 [Candidatus Izemoplasma sp.]
MINIIKLHFNFLLSKKTFIIVLTVISISVLVDVYFSNYFIDQTVLIIESEYYKNEYLFESISFIKFVIVIFSVFMSIESFIIIKYDYFLLSRISKFKFITSKLATLVLIVLTLTLILSLIMYIVSLVLTPYFFPGDVDIVLIGKLLLFGFYYTVISVLVVSYINNLFSLIIVLMGYFVSITSVDYLAVKEEVGSIVYIIQLLFIDLTNYKDIGYDFLYNELIILSFITVFLIKIVTVYLNRDI